MEYQKIINLLNNTLHQPSNSDTAAQGAAPNNRSKKVTFIIGSPFIKMKQP